MNTAIKVRELGRRFGHHWAVARFSLEIKANERLLVIGPNGCGKTTLLNVLASLLPPSQGDVSYPLSGNSTRNSIGYMGHDIGVYNDLSAEENLRVFARLGGFDSKEIKRILMTVGLDDRAQPVARYSAGMRRRLALALLLQKQPLIALLDEPFAQMDPGGIAQVSSAIKALPGAVIIASHQVHHAAPLADRAVLMDAGQIRWTGRADQAEAAWRALHKERGDL
jgi:ABC-type multidrug transport system ATPase subunit